MALPRNLQETTQQHLEQLVADGVEEGPHLDFKRDIPTNWDDKTKVNFCADASAFANAGGGDLIYGIHENGDGCAKAITPTVGLRADETALRLQDVLANNVEPRMHGVIVHPVTISRPDGVQGLAIIVRVPQSWVGPHRIRSNGQFYIREGRRKRTTEVPELRSLFLRTDAQLKEVQDFRTERIGRLLSGNASIRLVDGPLIVVHLIPTQAALGLVEIDPIPFTMDGTRQLPIFGQNNGFSRVNLDGALALRHMSRGGLAQGYSQFFRNGFFESVGVYTSTEDGSKKYCLGSIFTGKSLMQLIKRFKEELAQLQIDPELTVMCTLLKADQLQLGLDSGRFFLEEYQTHFDRSVVALPDSLVKSDMSPEYAAKPSLDMLWQAAGFDRCHDYDANGQWTSR